MTEQRLKKLKTLTMFLAALTTAVVVHLAQSQTAPASKRLSDTIKQGTGTIDLLKSADGMNAATLEALRVDNAGKLVFAVDVNENASGLETSKAQGVAVDSVRLDITIGGVTTSYTTFFTETQALIAPSGSTQRSNYYTLLGDAGSSLITNSNRKIDNATFDSTLKVPVNIDLSNATAAVLYIQLLATKPQTGDPEDFYDFTGGYEDLAILTKSTADYFDQVLPIPQESTFRSEAPAVQLSPEGQTTQTALLNDTIAPPTNSQIIAASTPLSWVLKPGASSFEILAYEDRYQDPTLPAGTLSDYDFNDAVIAYRYQLGVNSSGLVERISGEAYLIARGSNYTHNWRLSLPLPATAAASGVTPTCATVSYPDVIKTCALTLQADATGKQLQWDAFINTRDILPVTSNSLPQRNTFADVAPIQGPKATFSVVFDTPIALANIGAATPLLRVSDTQQDIALNARDSRGFPYGMSVPSTWRVPLEGQDMGLAYPSFVNFVMSSGAQAQSWYAAPQASKVLSWALLDWAW